MTASVVVFLSIVFFFFAVAVFFAAVPCCDGEDPCPNRYEEGGGGWNAKIAVKVWARVSPVLSNENLDGCMERQGTKPT